MKPAGLLEEIKSERNNRPKAMKCATIGARSPRSCGTRDLACPRDQMTVNNVSPAKASRAAIRRTMVSVDISLRAFLGATPHHIEREG